MDEHFQLNGSCGRYFGRAPLALESARKMYNPFELSSDGKYGGWELFQSTKLKGNCCFCF